MLEDHCQWLTARTTSTSTTLELNVTTFKMSRASIWEWSHSALLEVRLRLTWTSPPHRTPKSKSWATISAWRRLQTRMWCSSKRNAALILLTTILINIINMRSGRTITCLLRSIRTWRRRAVWPGGQVEWERCQSGDSGSCATLASPLLTWNKKRC